MIQQQLLHVPPLAISLGIPDFALAYFAYPLQIGISPHVSPGPTHAPPHLSCLPSRRRNSAALGPAVSLRPSPPRRGGDEGTSQRVAATGTVAFAGFAASGGRWTPWVAAGAAHCCRRRPVVVHYVLAGTDGHHGRGHRREGARTTPTMMGKHRG